MKETSKGEAALMANTQEATRTSTFFPTRLTVLTGNISLTGSMHCVVWTHTYTHIHTYTQQGCHNDRSHLTDSHQLQWTQTRKTMACSWVLEIELGKWIYRNVINRNVTICLETDHHLHWLWNQWPVQCLPHGQTATQGQLALAPETLTLIIRHVEKLIHCLWDVYFVLLWRSL